MDNWKDYLFLKKNEFIVISGSMFPSLKIGEKVRLIKIDYSKLKIGDVVVYKKKNKLIVHRLVFFKNFLAITKGDNKSSFDEPILVFDIIGKIEGKSSKKRLLWFFFRNNIRKIKRLFIKKGIKNDNF